MKSSLYNIYKKSEPMYILLNTFTRAAATIDEETKHLLEENPGNIPDDILEMLCENGFLVKDSCDEKKILWYYFDKDTYNVFLYDLEYTVVMTYGCNLACSYCYQGTKKGKKTFTTEKIRTLLKNMEKNLEKRDFDALHINLYGGEPLLAYHHCVQLMEGALNICNLYEKKLKGSILTNGVLINKEVVDTLIEPYCDHVQITMDGGRKAHNRRRPLKNGGGTYDILLGVLELLRDAGTNFTLKLNIDRGNVDTFYELSRDLKERGLENIQKTLGQIYPPNTKRAGKLCAGYAGQCFSRDEMLDITDKLHEVIGKATVQVTEIPKHVPCSFDREDTYVVDPYLDIYKCWEFIGKKDKKVGFIDENGETVFNDEYYKQVGRNPLMIEVCRDCIYLPACGGGCAAEAYYKNGTYESSPCETDDSVRHIMDAYIKNVVEGLISSLPEDIR